MKNKIVVSMAFFFILSITSLFFLPAAADSVPRTARVLPTYFTYSTQEIQKLKPLSSTNTITEEDLKKWDRLATHWMTLKRTPYYDRLRFFTYLYGAQRDAAFLSYNVHEHFEGTLDPVSMAIFQLFFPNFKKPTNYISDPYSDKLATIVSAKFSDKFNRENGLKFKYEVKGNGGYDLSVPESIANCASWIPWFVRPLTIYLPPPPPAFNDKVWEKQVQEIKTLQKKMTEEQKQSVFYWAGLAGPGSGDWRAIVNQFLFQNNVPLAKVLLVRSILTMSLSDTAVSYLYAKYKYAVMRPSVRDHAVEHLIPIPQHPSYPSGHSTEGTVTKLIMSHFFPDDNKKWDSLAEEAGMSRIYAGVHYPIDHEAGKALGNMIGEQILNRLRDKEQRDEKRVPQINHAPAMAH